MKKSGRINDAVSKLIGIPISAGVIFFIAGFAADKGAGIKDLFTSYLYLCFIVFCLWIGCVFIQNRFRNQLYQLKELYIRLPIRFLITIIISWGISFVLLNIWSSGIGQNKISSHQVKVSQLIMVFICLQITGIYETVYLNKERESDLVKIERSEKLKVQAQLDALKSQIDPHFIFNSLNTLSYLIGTNTVNAKHFNDTLAKVYRYILLNKEKDLVSLTEEIEFASNYFYLLKIRYQVGLSLVMRMDNITTENYRIPPLSLQALIENAIKHNHFSETNALDIYITVTADEIRTVNKKHSKRFDIQSSKIGLTNLNERYTLILNKPIQVEETHDEFAVTLPTLKNNT